VDPAPAPLPLTAPDGVELAADIAEPAGARAGAVLLHPHPRFGGNRLNAVVSALFRALPAAGIAALRFDFRPDSGVDGGDLAEERTDTVAALDALANRLPERPLYIVGYSFGAGVGLGVEHPAVTARVAIAPPLTMMRVSTPSPLPTLVLVPAFDNFAPPPTAAAVVAEWPDTTMEVIEGADHFLVGRAAAAAERALAWLAVR
jgi:alpha/beta superfamily hydrolase